MYNNKKLIWFYTSQTAQIFSQFSFFLADTDIKFLFVESESWKPESIWLWLIEKHAESKPS